MASFLYHVNGMHKMSIYNVDITELKNITRKQSSQWPSDRERRGAFDSGLCQAPGPARLNLVNLTVLIIHLEPWGMLYNTFWCYIADHPC